MLLIDNWTLKQNIHFLSPHQQNVWQTRNPDKKKIYVQRNSEYIFFPKWCAKWCHFMCRKRKVPSSRPYVYLNLAGSASTKRISISVWPSLLNRSWLLDRLLLKWHVGKCQLLQPLISLFWHQWMLLWEYNVPARGIPPFTCLSGWRHFGEWPASVFSKAKWYIPRGHQSLFWAPI